jgi:hypothetical protein
MFPFYLVMDVAASLAYDGYSYRDQTISELSAIDAPTRGLWLALSPIYQILAFAFAFGVLTSADRRPRTRIVAWLLLASAVTGVLWWLAPMHRREVLAGDGGTWQDSMHLGLAGASSLLFLATMSVGAFTWGRGFRAFSFAIVGAVLLAGTLMNLVMPGVSKNEPTPWIGVWERIAVEGSMLWHSVFAAAVLRRTNFDRAQ